MLALLTTIRKAMRPVAALAVFAALAACDLPAPSLDSGTRGGSVNVALLVPSSNAEGGDVIAASLENAARLAIRDLQGAEVTLTVYDTGGDPQVASMRATEAVRDGADVILGPLFADAAAAAGVAVQNRNVNVLAFSNNPSVAGGNVFILGDTFQNTAGRLVRYANAQGRGTIFVIHGQDTAEELGRDAILGAISNSGAELAGVESFALTQQDVINAIPRIADRIEQSDATAMFLTSGTDGALPLLVGLLPENGVDPEEVQTIGLRRFDLPSSALTLSGIQGGWFALPDPTTAGQFVSRYSDAYGRPPHPLAGLAYDGIAAIGALVASGERNALSAESLTRAGGYVGANGVFRFLPSGVNERGLAVATVENNQVIVIDPAPRSFGGGGL